MKAIDTQRGGFNTRVARACEAAGHHGVFLVNSALVPNEKLVGDRCRMYGFSDDRIVGVVIAEGRPRPFYGICAQCAGYPEDDFIVEVVAMLNSQQA